jgi:hypothetical protein
VLIVALAIQSYILTERITNKVIQKLQKEYGPSPYGPGFDPDKIGPPLQAPAKTTVPDDWKVGWEQSRK